MTVAPWDDEAWYASPTWSLIHHGNTGTTFLEPIGDFFKGINQWTYWVLPLQFVAQWPWYKVFGAGLLSARYFDMAWGLVALLAWGLIIRRLTGNAVMGFWTMALMACDYQFVAQMSLNRMDAMALSLASLAILSFVELREKNLIWAVLISQTCVAACGLTHPTPGVPALCAVVFLTLYFDRSRIGIKHVAIAAVPYVLGAAAWYAYISIAPDFFTAQFFGNVVDIDRLGGFRHPLTAIVREVGRYWGMGGHDLYMQSRLYEIKTLAILAYFVALGSLLAHKETRQDPRIRPVLWLLLVYVLVMTFYDNTKDVKYGVHLVPIYDALTAIWLVWCWRRAGSWRWIGAAWACIFAGVGVGGLLYTILVKDPYHHEFLPAANYLKAHAQPGDLILGGSELGFPLGFGSNVDDDQHFTYFSRKTPEFIVFNQNYRTMLENSRHEQPPKQYEYTMKMIDEDFQSVYSAPGYEILQRKTK